MQHSDLSIKIPRTIHYCWFGGAPLPDSAKKCIDSWKKYFPDYEIKQWGEDNFDVNFNQYTSEAYKRGKYAFLSDVARLFVIEKYGGIYFDLDVEVVAKYDDILEKGAFFGLENSGVLATGLGFGAEKGNWLVKAMLKDYDNRHFFQNGKEDLTPCPIINSAVAKKYGFLLNNTIETINGVTIYPKDFFNPKDTYTGKNTLTKNTHSIHHYDGSWLSKYELRRAAIRTGLFRIFGDNAGGILYSTVFLPYIAISHIAQRMNAKKTSKGEGMMSESASVRMEEISVKERKVLMLNMLKYIDNICRTNDIKYSLIGGSLIGAIRHKGYIPWDDDIDIILTQKNYEKLKEILDAQDGRYQTLKIGSGGEHFGFLKLIDTETIAQERYLIESIPNYGVYVDILCYYLTSENVKERKKQFRKMKLLMKINILGKLDFNNDSLHSNIRKLTKNLCLRVFGHKRIVGIFNKVASRYANEKSKYVISNWPMYNLEQEVQLKENTEKYIDTEFEGRKVMIFENYDKILRTTFGNYMQLPPERERTPKHNMQAWWKNKNGKCRGDEEGVYE